MSVKNIYWPYEILPLQQLSVQSQNEVRFLELAYEKGFRPYTFGSSNYGASFGKRLATIYIRSNRLWEVIFEATDEFAITAYLNDFNAAAGAVLSWLQGTELPYLVAQLINNVRETPHCPGGLIFRTQAELFDTQAASELLGSNLGGKWTVKAVERPGQKGVFDVIAERVGK